LHEALVEYFRNEMVVGEIVLQPEQARLRALLFDIGAVEDETLNQQGLMQLKLRISRKDMNQLSSKEHISLEDILEKS